MADNTSIQTSTSKNSINRGDLPWSQVLLPTTSAGHSGIGDNRHNLQPESWVYGIFLDDDMQQPMVLGVFTGGPGGGSGRGSSDTTPSTGTNNGTTPSSSGSDTSTIPAKSTSAGGNNTEKVWFALLRKGYTPQQAAGILGNLLNEGKNPSTGDISATQQEIGNSQAGYGIAQWTSRDRKANLNRIAGNRANTIEGQVDFLDWELKNTEKRAMRLLQNSAHDVDGAAIAFLEFERPGKPGTPGGYSPQLAKDTGSGYTRSNSKVVSRVNSARAVYKRFNGKSAPTS